MIEDWEGWQTLDARFRVQKEFDGLEQWIQQGNMQIGSHLDSKVSFTGMHAQTVAHSKNTFEDLLIQNEWRVWGVAETSTITFGCINRIQYLGQ